MSSIKSLYKSSSHYLAGNLGVMLLGLVSFPIMTRSVSVDEYGRLNNALRVALLVVVLAKAGLPHSMVRFRAEDGESPDPAMRERYYSTFILTEAFVSAVVTVVYAITVASLPDSIIGGRMRFLLLGASFFIFANALNSLLTGFLRAAGRSKAYAAVQFAVKLAAISTMLLLLYMWERSARSLLTSNVLAEVATLVIVTGMIVQRGLIRRTGFDLQYAKKIITFAAPLVIFEVSGSVLDGGDRLLIQGILGWTAAGFYSAAYNISTYVQDLIFASVNMALVPMWIRIWNDEGPAATAAFLGSSLNDFILVCCLIVCGTFAVAADLLVLLGSSQYRDAGKLVPYIVMGLIIYTLTTFFNAGLYLNKKTTSMATIVFTAAALNLLLNWLFLARFGVMAAVWATIVSYTFVMLCTAVASSRYLVVPVDIPNALVGIGSAAVVACALSSVDFHHASINFFVKGTLSVVAYGMLILAARPTVRRRLLESIGGK